MDLMNHPVAPSIFGTADPDGYEFTKRIPDASVSIPSVRRDVSDLATVGSRGLELVPFYFYGNPRDSPTPTDWTKFGFGMKLFQNVFEQTLQAAVDNELLVDFSLGASQGQGSPVEAGTEGLSVHLQLGVTSLKAGASFSAPVPRPQELTGSLRSGDGFMHGLTNPDQGRLKGVIAAKVLSEHKSNETVDQPKRVYLDEESILDLTHHVQNETLTWDAPPGSGTWKLFAFWEGHTNQLSCTNNGGNGTTPIERGSYVVDHFSKVGAQVHTKFFEDHILNTESIRANLKSNGNYAWEDSMELLFVVPWTRGFLERFQSSHGYGLVKYLPLLFTKENSFNAGSSPYPEEYSYGNYTEDGVSIHTINFRETLSECYRDYLEHHAAWAHSLGVRYSAQPSYNLPLGFLNEVPSLDAPEGESLGFKDIIDAYRTLSGPAQLAEKSDISSECGAEFKPAYSQTIPELLRSVKRAYAGGLTMMVLHGMGYSGPYANTSWPGYQPFRYQTTDSWNRIQPAWKHLSDVIGYMGRTQHILNTGIPRVDLAIFDSRTRWEASIIYDSDNLQDKGFTYNFVSPENLYLPASHVSQGLLAPNGPSYQALIFPNASCLSDRTLSKIREYDEASLPIIFIGTSKCLLGAKNVHRINSITELPDLLSQLKIKPRVSFAAPTKSVHLAQRVEPSTGREYVWLFNDESVPSTFVAEFHVGKSLRPSLLNTWNGDITPLARYQVTNTSVRIPVTLNPGETTIIAFEDAGRETPIWVTDATGAVEEVKYTSGKDLVANLKGPSTIVLNNGTRYTFNITLPRNINLSRWDIEIEDWHGDSNNTASIKTLVKSHKFQCQYLRPWKDLSKSLKDVSGVGIYTTTFDVPDIPNIGAYLFVGPILNTMRVWVNGKPLPTFPADYARMDISSFVSQGKKNEMRVEVTTTLYNRVRADANRLIALGHPLATMAPTFANAERQSYGLLGPVGIDWVIRKQVNLD
ncbi:hypothetical protein BDV06DRAFT_233866 [Aspergillus oleicola]